MRDHYAFSNSKPNLYANRMKKQVTMWLDADTMEYFKNMAKEKWIPQQGLINLRDCVSSHRELRMDWSQVAGK